jgi:hypothetical protein
MPSCLAFPQPGNISKNFIEVSAADIIRVNGTENAVKFKKKG